MGTDGYCGPDNDTFTEDLTATARLLGPFPHTSPAADSTVTAAAGGVRHEATLRALPTFLSHPPVEQITGPDGLCMGSSSGLRPHKPYTVAGPEGPNEDVAQCWTCGAPIAVLRIDGSTFGGHDDGCDQPPRHRGHCQRT